MFAIKILKGFDSVGSLTLDYQMISCDSYDVQYPNPSRGSTSSDDDYPIIGVWINNGEVKSYEGYPVNNVAYIINANGKTIDTIRP